MKRLFRRRPAPVAPAAPVDPRDLCAVLTCGRPWTVARHGYGLCDDHEAQRVSLTQQAAS